MGRSAETVHQPKPVKYVLKLPYLQRKQKHKMNQNFQKFLNIFRKLTIQNFQKFLNIFQKIDKQYANCQGIGANAKPCKVYEAYFDQKEKMEELKR